MIPKRWTEDEDLRAQELLKSGKTASEVAELLGRTKWSVSQRNTVKWKIKLKEIDYNGKLSRGVRKVAYKISAWQKEQGRWAGKKNPNYGAKIVKKGKDCPLVKWMAENPGYQNGEKNPSFGRIMSKEEIEQRTKKIIEINNFRKGKTNEEIYGKEKANKISEALRDSSFSRFSKQKKTGTTPELKIKSLLKDIGIDYVFQYPIGFYCVDFYIPSKNLMLQVDGCYWHACPKHYKNLDGRQKTRVRLDHSCDSYLINWGYKVLRLWECDIKLLDKEKLSCQLDLIAGPQI